MCGFLDYVSKAHNPSILQVRFGVQALPKPEPNLLEPEPMVQFTVWGNTRTKPSVWLAVQPKMAKNRTEPNLTITSASESNPLGSFSRLVALPHL
jgi:hypothetical protein